MVNFSANYDIDYSSICCFVGTSRGNVATFKILPGSDGRYTAAFVGSSAVDDKVINIIPIDADSGGLALATPSVVGSLRSGAKVNGVVIAVTSGGCRIFKPPTSKGAHKAWEDYICDSAQVVKTEGRGYSLVGLFGDGNARAFSIPGLRDIGCTAINHIADMRRLSEACITPTGNIMVWAGPSELGLFNVWGAGNKLYVYPTSALDDMLIMIADIPQKTVFTTPKLFYHSVLQLPTCNGSPEHNTSHQQTWIY
jgi:hypothetical protein